MKHCYFCVTCKQYDQVEYGVQMEEEWKRYVVPIPSEIVIYKNILLFCINKWQERLVLLWKLTWHDGDVNKIHKNLRTNME